MIWQNFDNFRIVCRHLIQSSFDKLFLLRTCLHCDLLRYYDSLLRNRLIKRIKGSVHDELNNFIHRDLHAHFISENIEEKLDSLFRAELGQNQWLYRLAFLIWSEVVPRNHQDLQHLAVIVEKVEQVPELLPFFVNESLTVVKSEQKPSLLALLKVLLLLKWHIW